MKKVRKLLKEHQVAQMPDEMRKKKNVILTITFIRTLLQDILSFAIKGAQLALEAGFNSVALVLMILYFMRQVIGNTLVTSIDTMKNQYNESSDAYITTSISEISNVVRGKVFRKKDDYSLIMTNAEVIFNLKEYVSYIWTFYQNFPILISNIVLTLVMIISILATEWIQTGNTKVTFLFAIILITCITIFTVLYKKRLKVKNSFREGHRKLRKENEVLLNDVKNIEPLIKKEFSYRVKLVVENLKSSRELERKEVFKLNVLQILRALVLAIFMLAIIIVKVVFAGGFNNFDIKLLTEIIAISTVYSNILDKVAFVLDGFEIMTNTVKDIESVKPDVDNIMEVYLKEEDFSITTDIEEITVKKFEFSYPGQMTLYMLRNSMPFILKRGKAYLVYGHTGCGKSTFMHLLIGKIKMYTTPISYGNVDEQAYLASIMHESNGRLGANPVLQELIFNKRLEVLDTKKMLDILHGTHIYDDVLRNLGLTQNNDRKVLDYLNQTTIEQYSSGQKQRLSIVKVLYNLDETHQIVVFDEATNALDDSTAVSVLKYMADFCQKDKERIVLFVSHQVNLTKEITDGSITFVSNQFPIYDIQVEV